MNSLAGFNMNFNIQLTPEDYIQAIRVHMRPRPVFKWAGCFMLSLAVIVLGISLYFAIVNREGSFMPVLLVAVLAYLAFIFLYLQPRGVRKIFWQQKSLQHPYSMMFTDELVSSKSDVGDAKLPWDHFVKWKEGKNLFMLYQSDVLFHMVPKRFFTSPEEMAQFRQLLQTKLGPAAV